MARTMQYRGWVSLAWSRATEPRTQRRAAQRFAAERVLERSKRTTQRT